MSGHACISDVLVKYHIYQNVDACKFLLICEILAGVSGFHVYMG